MTRRFAIVACLLCAPAAAQTFTKDVAPILFEHCAPCHRPGEAAPFPLLEYKDAKTHAKQIAAVTQSRYMPPWLPAPGKGQFAGERRLTDAQLRILKAWADNNAPEGDPQLLPPKPQFTEGWKLGKPDLVVTVDRAYTLTASGSDVFRNFVLRVPVDRTRYVRAIEVRPGNKKIVHHANVFVDRAGSSRLRDGTDGAPGFPGMDLKIESATFDPDSHFLFWKPGTVPTEEPPGMAWRLDPGTDLVLNMHLQPSGKLETLQPSIGLYFTDQAPTVKPMLLQLESDGALDIPPGKRDFVVSDTLTLPMGVRVLGVYPHAHYIGKDLQAYATLPDGTRRWLIDIPDWDINWQAVFPYKKPLVLPKGTIITMRYTYDNGAGNPRNPNHPPIRVTNGDRSIDEMAHLWLQVVPLGDGSGADPRIVLQEAVLRRRLEKYPADFYAQYSLGAIQQSKGDLDGAIAWYRKALRGSPDDAVAHNALGTALQQTGQLDQSLTEFQAALRSRPDYPDAHYNLARSLLAADRFPEAIAHLREVIRTNPQDAPALSDLGAALQTTGNAAEGMRFLREAVRVRPDYFNARYNLGQALAAAGQSQEAANEFRAALKLRPDDADTRQALQSLR